MTDLEFNHQLKMARTRVSDMDRIDGWKDREIGTVIAALESGIKAPDQGGHFDALVMLQDIREAAFA